jgi:hypothetical protein
LDSPNKIRLLVAAPFILSKQTQATWNDPNKEQLCQQLFRIPSDFRLWIPSSCPFLINGVGFHILVHALIQIWQPSQP